ncbi:MAG: Cro/CI family transcriptional regulator [Candidatus Scalindua sp.]
MLMIKTADAIKHFGSAVELAKALGISKQAIPQWGKHVPEGRAYQLQIITNGELSTSSPTTENVL